MMQGPPTLYSAYIRIERRCLLHPPETVKGTDVAQWPERCYSRGTRELTQLYVLRGNFLVKCGLYMWK